MFSYFTNNQRTSYFLTASVIWKNVGDDDNRYDEVSWEVQGSEISLSSRRNGNHCLELEAFCTSWLDEDEDLLVSVENACPPRK